MQSGVSSRGTMTSPFEGRVPTWSFNRLEDYTKCPYMAHLKYFRKLGEPVEKKDSPALVRGREIHTELERFIKGEIDVDHLSEPCQKHIDKFDWEAARERYAANPSSFIIEEEWAWDRDWVPCDWFGENVWGRAKVDRAEWLDRELTALLLVDYKSGKKFGNEVKHAMQMQEYCVICFTRFPTLEAIRVELHYTDEGKITVRKYTREQSILFMKLLNQRALAMTDATVFKPKPSKINCAYCSYGPNNGGSGECEYGVESK